MESIHFFSEDVDFAIENQKELIRWIKRSIFSHNRALGNINYIFCSDKFLHRINKEYLKHDTYTDIITFDQSEEPEKIEGDIYISVERVEENSALYHVPFQNELNRVMAHGILHLLGFNDKTKNEKEKMRRLEEEMLDSLVL